ncbi:ribbon-helix-helix protein, CopG family [Cellulomonas sp. IC4_254]|uniref:ribbon-helix-helix protein, CopG family n=1 Tax=Cellulomonas sp. IC4_254 TaxID=2714040 RepID=UPI0014242E91|nr:ribbon-helix-helix protein, CopG family [Cellulomonas sp. IC4_254]NHT19057.1 ribbon-helix-helix protein, CopG family [Cellulomonas sp. IC4_254]
MKTAISIPDHEAARIDASARRHGMTRSEFYRRAAGRFADELEAQDVTQRIDDAIAAAGQPGATTEPFRRAAGDLVAEADW